MFNNSKSTAYLTIFTVLFFFTFPVNSFAKWKDKSGELPGMMSTEEIILIGVGTAAVIGLLLLASSSGDDQNEDMESHSVAPDSLASSAVFKADTFSQTALLAAQDVNVLPYVSWQKESANIALVDNKDFGRVVVGVTVIF